MKTALITGANRSIGFETARQLVRAGYFIYLGSRDFKKGIVKWQIHSSIDLKR